ncbi:helix-turn-helix domain-containing protein [Bacillus sp. CH30_1T]|uniref:helix-turn-helix domain-containing protein n=1 Tax=Bacillus sp. CH30_1T TaxID=2604836 RepID=UPI0021CD6AF1|nr:helix-turn-helix transcriptional regulator [Bacillus sp. CH30_1T]
MNYLLKITLKAARVNSNLNLVEAAEKFGINKDTLWKYERDSTNVPRTFFIQIEGVYGIPVDNIFFGNVSEFFRNMSTA